MKKDEKTYEVSVIIPTYRPGEYISDCLVSLNSQTLSKAKYEVILILNGPKTPYYSQLVNILERVSFIYKIYYSEIPNVSIARNIGLEVAHGSNICFIDDDDMVSSNYLEELLNSVSTCSIAVSNVQTFVDNINQTGQDYLSRAFRSRTFSKSIFYNRKFFSSSCAKILPKSIINNKQFDETIKLGEDALFMASISKNVKNVIKVEPDVIYYRRLRSMSASRKKYSREEKSKIKKELIKKYLKIYLSAYSQYNILFFLSRIVATMKK